MLTVQKLKRQLNYKLLLYSIALNDISHTHIEILDNSLIVTVKAGENRPSVLNYLMLLRTDYYKSNLIPCARGRVAA